MPEGYERELVNSQAPSDVITEFATIDGETMEFDSDTMTRCERTTCDNAWLNDSYDYMNVFTLGGEQQWCEDCANLRSWVCDSCSNWFDSYYESSTCVDDESNVCSECDDNTWYCDNCETNHWDNHTCERVEQELMSYNFKPRPIHKFASNEIWNGAQGYPTPTYGIELESENVTHQLNEAIAAFRTHYTMDDFYLKSDGSLSYGMEIVSHPRSLASWREIAPELAVALKELSGLGQRAWSQTRAGLHIHVGRKNFTTSHAARFVMLFARNAEDWIRLANRKTSYASFSGIEGAAVMKVKNPTWAAHSDAVNTGANGGTTIEIRIFRPSLSVGRVIGSIELVDAAIAYTRNMTAYDAIRGALAYDEFKKYVMSCDNWPLAKNIMRGLRFNMEILPPDNRGDRSCA